MSATTTNAGPATLPATALPAPGLGLVAFLLLGPAASMLAAHELHTAGYGGAVSLGAWLAALAVIWSPLPISLPAVLLDTHRDAALSSWRGPARILRAGALLPYLLLAPASAAKIATAASLAGWIAALAVRAHIL